jgi:hypothetical protein
MKKILSIILVLTATMMVQAKEVVFDFTNPADLGLTPAEAASTGVQLKDSTITVDGVSISFTVPSGNGAKLWTKTGPAYELRLYTPSTIKFASTGEKIKTIRFTASQFSLEGLDENKSISLDTMAYSFTVPEKGKANYITSISVWVGEEAPVQTIDTISVSEARQRIDDRKRGACYIKGVAAGMPFIPTGTKYTVWMTDINNAADSIEAFNIMKDAKTNWASLDEMKAAITIGDTILVYADGLDLYNNTIYETTSGYFAEMIGKASFVDLSTVLTYGFATNTGVDTTTYHWNLTLKEAATSESGLVAEFNNGKAAGIAGYYPLLTGVYGTDSINGSLKLTYVSTNVSTGYNTYAVELVFMAAEKQYRFNNEMEIAGFDAEYEELVLADDVPFIPNEGDTITCAQAKEYAMTLASGATSTITVTVIGYANNVSAASGTEQTFFIDDVNGSNVKTVQAYYCYLPELMEVTEGSKVAITGKMMNYNGKVAEMKNGQVNILEGGKPVERDITYEEIPDTAITVAEARQIGAALQAGDTSDVVTVKGFVAKLYKSYDASKKQQSFYMYDNMTDGTDFFDFEAFKTSIEVGAIVGDYVFVTGRITVYTSEKGTTYNLVDGTAHYAYAPTGIQEVLKNADTESVQKVMIDGRLYILRDGVAYDMQGAVVR